MAKVRDHIWVVRKHLDYENTEEVIPALVPISSALDEIENLVPVKQAAERADETTRPEVKKLVQDIVTLEGNLGKDNQESGATITNLWERSEAICKREAEYISTGWQKLRDQNRLMNDLIEAKLHLAYAESYQFTTGEITKAIVELHDTEAYLESAAEHMDSKMKSKINALEKMVDQINADLNSKKETARESYGKAKSDLGQLIRDL